MMRRLLSQHSMAECPKRTQPCKYCGKEFVYDTIQVGFPSRPEPGLRISLISLHFGMMELVKLSTFPRN